MSYQEALRRIRQAYDTQDAYLDLAGLEIQNIPQELFSLLHLKSLNLKSNQLTGIPREIERLTSLRSLDVSTNRLKSLPARLGKLVNMQILNLSENELISIPPELGKLPRLTELYLNGNQILDLPVELGNLLELQTLFINNNQIIKIPIEIVKLKKLKLLRLENNPLNIPDEIASKDNILSSELRSYLLEIAKVGSIKLNEAKIVIVGEGDVGKTSLVKRLIYRKFNPSEPKTEGIAIERWMVDIKDRRIRLNVWDFGGQEIMHATHQFFMTKRSVYILVINCRRSEYENRLDYWMKLIQSFALDAPVIIVGNKADQHPLDIDKRGLKEKYSQIKGFYEISCIKDKGIYELRQEIINQVSNLAHINDALPRSWRNIKDELEKEKRDYISLDDFQSLCFQQNIQDPESQLNLLGLLHDLGTVLSYHDDPRLTETKVLNPEWVTNGVYTILNRDELMYKRNGIVSMKEIVEILSIYKVRYPLSKCTFISEMMEKFELCYRIDRDHWLIPDLLPKEEPAIGSQDNTLHFIYKYPVLPSSIMGRFIVRFQHAIVPKFCWRNGVVLKTSNNWAIVKSDVDSAKIDIHVGGQQLSRRRFLSAIRRTFEQIHYSLSGLRNEVQELVPLPNHPDHFVDYNELLGWEIAKQTTYFNGKLRKSFPLTQLLDGYETDIERQSRQVDTNKYPDADTKQLQALLKINQDNLNHYERQKAQYGLYIPPYVQLEIERLKLEIDGIRAELKRRGITMPLQMP